jgi:Skp family chaperone for outer membrane proteins
MKTFRLIVGSLIFGAIFTFSAFAQADTGKVAIINTSEFILEKGGIVKYVSQQKKLNSEFTADTTELNGMIKKINTLKTELKQIQDSATTNKVPIKRETVQAKADEHDALVREYNYKAEDVKSRFDARSDILLSPVRQDIFKALQEFAKQKGYVAVLDINQLLRTKLILALNDKYDITKEFIAFYNARPAATATK